MKKRGFTLIEVMVATVLFGIVTVTLSMVFSSSAAAWRIGRAGVLGMHKMRRDFSIKQLMADHALPNIQEKGGGIGYVRVLWTGGGSLQDSNGKSADTLRAFTTSESDFGSVSPGLDTDCAVESPVEAPPVKGNELQNYMIRAGSAGPDREWGTEDDIIAGPRDKRKEGM